MGVQDPNLNEEPDQASLRSHNYAPGFLVLGHFGDLHGSWTVEMTLWCL